MMSPSGGAYECKEGLEDEVSEPVVVARAPAPARAAPAATADVISSSSSSSAASSASASAASAASAASEASTATELPEGGAGGARRVVVVEEEASAEDDATSAWKFRHLAFELATIKSGEARESWTKWGLALGTQCVRFAFGRRFEPSAVQAFLCDFFNSPEVRAHFQVGPKSPSHGTLPIEGTITSVSFEPLRTTKLRMDFFDRVTEAGLVGEDGLTRRCLDNVIEGCTVADLMRDVFVNPDSENSHLYDDDDRAEFLFQLFRWVVTGGSMCQWDDDWNQYQAITKGLYKELLSVFKNPHSGALEVVSLVFRIQGWKSDAGKGAKLFPSDNVHNNCFLLVDPSKRQCTLLYCPFVSFW